MDEAHGSGGNRLHPCRLGIEAAVGQPCDQAAHRKAEGSRGGRPPTIDGQAHERRHAASACPQHRAVATRCDELALRYQATIHVAAINIRLHHTWSTTWTSNA
ncbi:hypothetical protein [Saccharothrix syringae]|uniref:Uncharacterized protein n=1 Tax=Saccharothrix syringae TaxID=103733 RepID=A0A5Q0HC51_SACSY|nr:hypothetical protein [Saccharothrix syringae]QFZ23534.1 hypothetical protein EKG83_44290 [Saccharothrix syringae]